MTIFGAFVVVFISAMGGIQLTFGTTMGYTLAAVDFALAGINLWLLLRGAKLDGHIEYLKKDIDRMRGFTLIELLVVLAIVGILTSVVFAAIDGNKNQQVREEASAAVFDSNVPEPTNYAVDTTGKLTADQLAALNAKLKVISDSGKEIAVLMVPTTGSASIEQYGIVVGDKWKVGKSGKDNGAIIIVATDDRKIRIELGRGAEGDITDSQAGDIIRDVLAPHFKQGDWYGGLDAGVDAINGKLK